jgi:hypothetical protein
MPQDVSLFRASHKIDSEAQPQKRDTTGHETAFDSTRKREHENFRHQLSPYLDASQPDRYGVTCYRANMEQEYRC